MRRLPSLGLVIVCVAVARAAPPPREVYSENKRFLLQIEPGRPGRTGRTCQALLWQAEGAKQRGRKVWERPLVNEVAPAHASVRNDGQFVVTLDEYRRGGVRNAVVVYGPEGQLLRHFLLTDLLTAKDWPHVRVERRAILWLERARYGFDDERGQFVIRLAWGNEVRIDLRRLRVMRTDGLPAADDAVPTAIRALLEGQAVPTTKPTDSAPQEPVTALTPEEEARAAEVAAELAQIPPAEPVESADDGHASSQTRVEPPSDAMESTPAPELSPGSGEDAWGDRAGALCAPLPPPDPMNKTNYVAWFNELGRVPPEQDAWPLLKQAAEEFVPWAGPEELFYAALRGEPQAVNHPDVIAWIKANQSVLDALHRARQRPQRGWQYESPDGTLLNVALPHVATLRSATRLCLLDGLRLASTGQPMAAAERYLDALTCGAHLSAGATLVEHLMGAAIQTMAATELIEFLAVARPGDLDYDALAASLEAVPRPGHPAAAALQWERATSLDVMQRLWSYDPHTGSLTFERDAAQPIVSSLLAEEGGPTEQVLDRLAAAGFDQSVTDVNSLYDAAATAVSLPFPDAAARLAELDDRIATGQFFSPIVQVLSPAFSRYHLIAARGDVVPRAAQVITQLNAYRQQFGSYPESLDELDRPLPSDPFTNRPFAYRRQGDSFVLYSLGANGTDDGGVHGRLGDKNDVLVWPPPP